MRLEVVKQTEDTDPTEIVEPVVKRLKVCQIEIELPVTPRKEYTSDGERISDTPRIGYELKSKETTIEKLGGYDNITYVSKVRLSPRETTYDVVNAVAMGKIDMGIVGSAVDHDTQILAGMGLTLHEIDGNAIVTRMLPGQEVEQVMQNGVEQAVA